MIGFYVIRKLTEAHKLSNYIFEIPISQIISIFNEVGKNYPHSSKMEYCEKIKDYKIMNE